MGRKPCCDKVGLKRGPWTVEEDQRLMSFIVGNGIHCWRTVPKLAGLLRCGKSCRLRWINYLRPDLKRGGFTEAEDDEIIRLHQTLGNRWSKIASHFVGRTDNEIKNHWNTKIKKRLKEICVGGLVSKKSDENRDTVSEAVVNKLAQNDQTKDEVDNDEDDLLSNYEIFNGSLEVIDHWLNEDSIEDLDAQSSSASFQESLNASISDSGVRDGSPYLHQWFDEMDSFLDAQLFFSQLYQL